MKHFLPGIAFSFLKPIFVPTGTYQLPSLFVHRVCRIKTEELFLIEINK